MADDGGKVRVAMIGSRGMPAQYGGVETVVEVLATELAERGHEVTVFCRTEDYEQHPSEVDGVRLVYVGADPRPGWGALVHAFRATMWSIGREFDVLHYHALGPGLMTPLGRLFTKARIVQTIHGRDDKRAKWGGGARLLLRLGARLSARVPHQTLVVSHDLAREYREDFDRETIVVPNAIRPIPAVPPGEALAGFGLEAGRYVVSVGRLVPEKAPHELIAAYAASDLDVPLVLVGGAAGTEDYARRLSDQVNRSRNVRLTGPVYGDALGEILSNAAAFVTASTLEGLPTALIEAGRLGVPCVASDIAPHVEILGEDGPGRRTYPLGDGDALIATLRTVLDHQAEERDGAVALAADLEDRFSTRRAAEIHEVAYGVPIDLRESVEIDLTTSSSPVGA